MTSELDQATSRQQNQVTTCQEDQIMISQEDQVMMHQDKSDLRVTDSYTDKSDEEWETPKPKVKVRSHKCAQCSKVFPSRAHLREHEVSHSNALQYTCPTCGTGFKRKNALNRHLRMLHPDGPTNVTCSCGKVFASSELMEKHKATSGRHRLLVCPECGVLYKTKASLESHLLLHRHCSRDSAAPHPWPYTCHRCQERFSSRASLLNHTKSVHSTRVFQCGQCDKMCKTQLLLQQHRLRRHTESGPCHLCPMCGKAFHILKDLRRHVLSHGSGNVRKCPVCSARFKTDATLHSHMKTHSRGKPYDCTICLLPCGTLEELRQHILECHGIHDVGREFSEHWGRRCLVCGQVFLRRAALAHHMKSHVGHRNNTHLLLLKDASTSHTQVRPEPEGAMAIVSPPEDKMDAHLESQDNHSFLRGVETDTTFSEGEELPIAAEFHIANDANREPVGCHKERSDESTTYGSVPVDSSLSESYHGGNPSITEEGRSDANMTHSNAQMRSSTSHGGEGTSATHRESSVVGTSARPATPALQAPAGEPEETRYICGACSAELTDVAKLRVHLLTCYKQDSSDECFVVFEVEENKG